MSACCLHVRNSTDWGFPIFLTLEALHSGGYIDEGGNMRLHVKVSHAEDDCLLDANYDSKKTTDMVGLKNQVSAHS